MKDVFFRVGLKIWYTVHPHLMVHHHFPHGDTHQIHIWSSFIRSEMARFQTLRLLNHIVGCISTSIPPFYPHCGWYSNRKKHEGPSTWKLKLALKNWMLIPELHAIRTYRICGFSDCVSDGFLKISPISSPFHPFLMVFWSNFDPFHPFLDPFHPFPYPLVN